MINRILIINGKMICGGVESFIMNIYRHINRDKIQFDFLVHYKESFFYDKEIESMGGRIYRLSFREDNNLIKYKKELNDFFKEHKEYQIVWGHMSGLASIYLKIAKKNHIKCTICHSHITQSEKGLKGIVKSILKLGIPMVSDIRLACSTEAGRYLFGNAKFYLCHNAIDVERFTFNDDIRNDIRQSYGISNNELIYCSVGRFEKQKNQKFLVDVFIKVHGKNKKTQLWFFGTGSILFEIQEYVKQSGISDCVKFFGDVSDIYKYYNACDFFLMPSLYEGLPVSGVEAQTSGLYSVFSSSITKEAGLIKDGFLFLNISTPDLWVDRIMNLTPLSMEKRRECKKEIIKEGFEINQLCRQLEGKFESIINGKQYDTHN